jgi:16S rRNA (cytidine1402-2'-O)-methyltransferase
VAGRLIICATPIGNLEDVSPRLRSAIEESEFVYAEDTRRSRVLLEALGVNRPLRSYFTGNEAARSKELATRLAAGAVVALVTDAGTPAIADPGYSAVRAAIEAGAEVTVVPGPSAVTAALAVSGLPTDRFVFEGFLPRKKGLRAALLEDLAVEPRTIVLFASPGRVAADLSDLAEHLGRQRPVTVARELTKAFEEVWRGTLDGAAARWTATSPRGEFTLVVAGAPADTVDLGAALDRVEALQEEGTSLSEAVRSVAAQSGIRRRTLYEAALRRNSTDS